MVSAKQVRTALYQKLNVASLTTQLAQGSASLIHSVASPSSAYPLVIFSEQSSTVMARSFGGTAVSDTGFPVDSQLWLVKAIAKGGSSSVAEDVDATIAGLLDFQQLTITGADHMYLARESAVAYAEVVEGETYRHHGHLYRLILQPT